MLLHEFLVQVHNRLSEAGIPDAQLEAELILEHVCNKNRAQLFLERDYSLSKAELDQCEKLLVRRCTREPLAYILGEQEFWSLPFKVTPDVLIPRPETELLVEAALEFVSTLGDEFQGPVLDIGTGSGIIPIVLAKELPQAYFYAIDRSPAALQVARENADCHEVSEKIQFLASDLFQGIDAGLVFPLIVSNPPYVVHDTIRGLEPEVCKYEPHLALDGGEDGLDTIRLLAEQLGEYLAPGGGIVLEIGFDQEEKILQIFNEIPFLVDVQVRPDYAGLARICTARRKRERFQNE